jgi:hypothetical protein
MADWSVPQRSMPRPSGENPFRVKGHGILARMAVYDRVVPGGRRAVLEAVDDPATRSYLSQLILAVGWYDLFAHAALDLAAADLRGMDPGESLASASALQARADASGIYSLLLKVVSPQLLVRKLGKVSAQYFDHGAVEVVRLDGKAARMTRTGIANQLYWWWSAILEGYVRALFALAGARDLEIHRGALESAALDDPLGIGRFSCDLRWR